MLKNNFNKNAKKNYTNNYMHTTNSKNQYNVNRYTQYERKKYTNRNKQQIINQWNVNVQSIDVRMLMYKFHPVIYNAYNRTETNTVYQPVLFWECD